MRRICFFISLVLAIVFNCFENNLYAQSDPITIERSRMTISFVPPGPLGDLEVTSFLGDTTVVFYGANYEIRLEEKGRVFSKKANINYESRAIAAGCGEPRSYRQSDFVEWFTGVTGGTSSTPLKINGYNACLQLSEGVFGAKDEEPTFSFSVTVPFYSLSCTGPVDQKEAFLETFRSFSFYDIDPELQVPSDKEIPKGIIELADRMIFEPFEDIVDTDVVLSRDENINVEDIMNPMCKPNWIPNEASGINLGITQTFQTTIRRDGFLALSAQAEDIDMISLSCRTLPKCGEKGETWMRYLHSPTRISWKILNPVDEVSFVQVGYLPENQHNARGENVILRPPDIFMPGEVKTIRIQLKGEDIGTRSYIDSDKEEMIELVFKGVKNGQGEVDIQVEVKGKVFRAAPIHQPSKETADCKLVIEPDKTRTLEKPVIQIPAISQSTTLAWGEKLYLTVKDQQDEEKIAYSCSSDCGVSEKETLTFQDELIYTWEIVSGEGHFLVGNRQLKQVTGKSAVYLAPANTTKPVKISVYASNRNQDWMDQPSPKTFLDLQIREPAIVLKTPDNTWLPDYNFTTELPLKLSVVINPTTREVGPALPHMAALANIAMNNISQHNGICTNYDDQAQPEREKYDIFFDLVANLPHFGGLNTDPMDPNRASMLRGKVLLKGDKPSMVKVKTMDYGASAQISLENYPPEYQAFPNNRFLIPADDNQNGIPDASKKHDNAVSADYDNDDEGLNIWTWGDGLTNWEEYRGFRVCTDAQCQSFTYRRTDPEKRDFFLYSEFGLTYANFEKAANLNVEFINTTLMDEKRVINYLSDFHKGGDQYAVHVKRGEPVTNWSITSMLAKAPLHLAGIDVQTAAYYMDIFLKGEMEEMPWWFGFYWSFIREGEGVLGKAQHADGFTDKGYFTPNQVKYLVINPYKVARLGYNLEEVINHELGHTCNLPHHGGNEVRKICLLNKGKPQTYDYITGGTVYSGEMSCMMRYEYPGAIGTIPGKGYSRTECIDCDINRQQNRANLIQIRDEVTGWKKPDKTVVKRDKFCTSRGAGQPYGATAEGTGECYQRIRVKCW